MRSFYFLGALAASSILTGCVHAAVVQPGHRGILFDPMAGLKHEVLAPGYYHLANACKEMKCPRVDDFDVTYSTAKEQVRAHSTEGLGLDTHMAIVYRPVISELFQLDTEVGANYYDEVVGHEVRSAAIGVLARHSYTELRVHNREIEDEIEKEVRERIKGKHVEIDSITMEIDYAPEIEQAMRAKAVGEQDAARQKAFLENDALKRKLELEHSAEQARLKAETEAEQTKLTNEAELLGKQHELEMAKEQAALDKVSAEGDAISRITRAKTQAEEMRLLAKGQADKNRAEGLAVTPLMVQMHAYDALGQLGGKGTQIMLGDWSHVPNFLFPHMGPLAMPPYAPASITNPPQTLPPAAVPIKTRVEDKSGWRPGASEAAMEMDRERQARGNPL
jgi:prohibitin 2